MLAEWSMLMQGVVADHAPRHVAQGSLSWLVGNYMASAAWAELAPATRKQRRWFYSQITDQAPDAPAASLTAADMRRWRDNRAATPGAANNMIKSFSALYGWGVEMGHVTENPAKEVKRLKAKKKGGFPAWTIEDLRRFRAHWPKGSKPHLALCLLLFTACRRADVVRLGRQHVTDGWMCFDQDKTGERVEVPILPPLAEVLPRDRMTFLMTEHVKPFSVAGFGNWFRTQCEAAGVSKRAHGLRKAAGGLLAEMGCTENEIMAVLGHSDERTTSIYTRSASRRMLAESAMRKMGGFKW
jgi:integrase